jgi:hypothetical protein
MAEEPDRESDDVFPEEEVTPPSAPSPGTAERPPEQPKGSLGRGMVSAVAAAIAYLVVPLAVVQLLTRLQPMLTLQPGAETAIILFGALLVVAGFYAGYASENLKVGSIARLCETGLTALYLFLVAGRGPVLITLGAVVVTLDITGYFILLLVGTLLHGLSPAWDLVQYLRGRSA